MACTDHGHLRGEPLHFCTWCCLKKVTTLESEIERLQEMNKLTMQDLRIRIKYTLDLEAALAKAEKGKI